MANQHDCNRDMPLVTAVESHATTDASATDIPNPVCIHDVSDRDQTGAVPGPESNSHTACPQKQDDQGNAVVAASAAVTSEGDLAPCQADQAKTLEEVFVEEQPDQPNLAEAQAAAHTETVAAMDTTSQSEIAMPADFMSHVMQLLQSVLQNELQKSLKSLPQHEEFRSTVR